MSQDADDVFVAARAPREDVPRAPVHGRVLEHPEADGLTWAFVCWSDPGGPRALHAGLQRVVETALLLEASRSRASLAEGDATPRRLALAVYPPLDATAAVAPFALRADATEARWKSLVPRLRGEAQRLGLETLTEASPASRFIVEAHATESAQRVEATLRTRTPADEVWGAVPGAPFARLLRALDLEGTPPRAAFDAAEAKLVSREADVLRWLPPLTFQALADGAGVVADRAFGRRVAWGLGEADEAGLSPPPVMQLPDGNILHVGLELLRWCVMPLREGESPPPFTAWLESVL